MAMALNQPQAALAALDEALAECAARGSGFEIPGCIICAAWPSMLKAGMPRRWRRGPPLPPSPVSVAAARPAPFRRCHAPLTIRSVAQNGRSGRCWISAFPVRVVAPAAAQAARKVQGTGDRRACPACAGCGRDPPKVAVTAVRAQRIRVAAVSGWSP